VFYVVYPIGLIFTKEMYRHMYSTEGRRSLQDRGNLSRLRIVPLGLKGKGWFVINFMLLFKGAKQN